MRSEWDESFFESGPADALVYWVCFWSGDDIEQAASHDPQRITEASSVEEVLEWLHREKGDRRYELFVESREPSTMKHPNLIRLGGNFRPGGQTRSIPLVPTS